MTAGSPDRIAINIEPERQHIVSARNVIYAPLAILKRAEKRTRLLRFTLVSAGLGAVTVAVAICLPYLQTLLEHPIP